MAKVSFSHVEVRHEKIHHRLDEWARWVRVGWTSGKPSPIFMQYRSHAWQWEVPTLVIPIDSIRAHQTEKGVAALPTKNREAIRWSYVFPFVPVSSVRRSIGVTEDGLLEAVNNGRDMLKNRMGL